MLHDLSWTIHLPYQKAQEGRHTSKSGIWPINSVLEQSGQQFSFPLPPEGNTFHVVNVLLYKIAFCFPSCHSPKVLAMSCLLPDFRFHMAFYNIMPGIFFTFCSCRKLLNDTFKKNKSSFQPFVTSCGMSPMLPQSTWSQSINSPR